MIETLEYTGQLTVMTCWCGMVHAVPKELRDFQLRQHRDGKKVETIYCPLGHGHAPAGESEAKVERERNARLQARIDQVRADRDSIQRSLTAQKGATTRMRNRVHAGTCIHCDRHFVNLEHHMRSAHKHEADDV